MGLKRKKRGIHSKCRRVFWGRSWGETKGESTEAAGRTGLKFVAKKAQALCTCFKMRREEVDLVI